MQSGTRTGAMLGDLLKEVPEDASPRVPWPFANPRKQVALENKFFEEGATIHFERLQPLQSWAGLSGLNMQMRTNFVAANVVRLASEANMRLTQTEIDSIAETSAKNFKRGAWAAPTAALFAGAAFYHGRADYKFPFFKPVGRAWFHPQAFPTTRWTILRGSSAILVWHAARWLAYYPLFKFATTIFYSSIMKMSIAADVVKDTRLARVQDAILHRISPNSPRGRRAQQAHDQSQAHVGQSESDQRDETYRRVGLPPPSPEEMRRFPRQSQTPATASSGQGDAQSPVDWASTERQQAPAPSQSSQSSSWGDSELFDDDASPVSLAARRAEQAGSAAQQSAPGVSSWDQIRRQAKSATSPFSRGDRSGQETAWSKVQQEASTPDRGRERGGSSDNYSYSETDEKSQAQKDFDAMLEAERKGESGSGSRWR
ncbi:hypothetical protein PFICI_10352 [Pestalotiopsis fici W106-1]|uniref:Uncharacterized protein n=1 Tax=Pestalotiopsis fici (strain W106-1 / CGMCC3.15140) TaxID=1229662 RepID=W3WWR7_PESFW|nr:uncharacterized protein PFICI_10352 [Pestalotiopsis fici W106-1]ETS78290.1 hypothetical protein PFICI_10352 [Pestalotiopsis fici W106-1]